MHHLFTALLVLGSAVPLGVEGQGVGVLELGVDRVTILRELGTPSGVMELPSRVVMIYPHAELTLVEGRLTDAVWKSAEEVAMEKQLQERAKADYEARQKQLALERRERGERILTTRRADPVFQSRPAKERIRLWAEFMRDYPGIDASEDYKSAMGEFRVEQEAERARLAEVAAAAEERRQEAQRYSSARSTGLTDTVSIGGNMGWGNYPRQGSTVIVTGGAPCPPLLYPPQRPLYDDSWGKPILSIDYQGSRGGFQFKSGGDMSALMRRSLTAPARPVVIHQRQ